VSNKQGAAANSLAATGSGATGSGATDSGATGSGATDSSATDSGATDSGATGSGVTVPGLLHLPDLQAAIAADPNRWRPLVFTNGCFDLLHAGHVRYLRAARARGRSLVVGLNSDASVRSIKPTPTGYPDRPIVPETQRAEVLAALAAVDAVVIFGDRTATGLITALQPDIYVKGGDYRPETLPEAPAVQAYGGQIELVAIEVPTGTSDLIERILAARSTPTAS
jgi:rfaE bifunctional protein nucleotidyltransferase chain/domain